MRYPIPAREARSEIKVTNSRFIACAAPAFTVDAARTYIGEIKAEFTAANHHVPAFLIGYGSNVTAHSSDAGEPSGTAGRPVLTVLQGSGLGDIVVVVVRFFGGIKLGTGGLVRAYTDAAKAVLEVLPRAEKVPTQVVMAAFEYTYYERIRLLIAANYGQIISEDFGADVTLTVRLVPWAFHPLQKALDEITRGAVRLVVVDSNPETILPIGSFPPEP